MAISPVDVVHLLDSDLAFYEPSRETRFWPGMTIQEAAAVSIRNSIVQKWSLDNSDQADEAALKKFLHYNQKCKEWSLPGSYDTRTEMLLGGFKTAVWDFWLKDGYPLVDHPYDVLAKASIGPGANIGARGGDFYTKFFSSPLTSSTESMYNWYIRYTANFAEWKNAENIRSLHFDRARIVQGSRLSFVPKNDKISRCICTEPTLNTFYQLGFGRHLEERLKGRFGIDLKEQQFKNRDLARLGSITNGLVTLDLSSASDSISLSMVRALFPPDFVRWLEAYRCAWVEIPKAGTVEMHMLSSMGNGYTFPLETMIFAAVVSACANFRGIPLGNAGRGNRWGVFGDDIICPVEIHRDVIDLLTLLGFTLNSDKSFVEGPFRESCGSDFYLGTDIRGVYLKRLDSVPALYSAINQLLRFQTRTGIFLHRLVGRLVSALPRRPHLVPGWENMDSGIHVPLSLARKCYNRDLQSLTYLCLVASPPKIRVKDDDVVVPRSQKRRIFNPSGLLISFLQGSINGCSIGVRTDTVPYRQKRRVAPAWGVHTSPARDRQDYGLDWGRWNTVVEDSLMELLI